LKISTNLGNTTIHTKKPKTTRAVKTTRKPIDNNKIIKSKRLADI
jgi:hypothetical protein